MRVFLYEFFSGGGALAEGTAQQVLGAVLPQARLMWRALADDLQRGGCQVLAMRDARWPPADVQRHIQWQTVARPQQERELFHRLGAAADWTILIAPESNQALLKRVLWAEYAGWPLASPGSSLVRLASDKDATCRWLHEYHVAVPLPWPPERIPGAADRIMVKPRDGCGSQGVRRIQGPEAWLAQGDLGHHLRCEQFCPGQAVSAAALGTGNGWIVLPAGEQWLGGPSCWEYLGGRFPLDRQRNQRARQLVERALSVLPAAHGYVGLDLVLGEEPEQDVVIEVNPRITSSYIPLSRLCRENLAMGMIQAAGGNRPELRFGPGPIEHRVDLDAAERL